MQGDKKTLHKFKRLCEKEFGEKFSDKEVFEMFNRMVNELRIVYYPNTNLEREGESKD